MRLSLRVTAKWLGYMVERTLLLVGGVAKGVALDVLSWAIDLALFPIRCAKAYERAVASMKKGGHDDDR